MESPLEVSVVVPVRDGAGTLGPLLDGLERQTLDRDRFEVIVVDNASRDTTAAVAREHGARVVWEARPNRALARNRGVEAARASLIAFTDGDCTVAPGWLEALVRCAPNAPLVAGPVQITTDRAPNRIERFEALWRFGQESWITQQGWAATANLAVSREAFEAVGGLDPSWQQIGEDVDFCIRAGRAGFGLGWCPDAVAWHHAESRIAPMLRRSLRHGYSVNQAFYRLGLGYRAWQHPLAAVSVREAFARLGVDGQSLARGERRWMGALARLSYAARIVGSVWAELRRAR